MPERQPGAFAAPLLDEVIDVDTGGWTSGGPTRCRLRLFAGVHCLTPVQIAVVTELAENRGLSITNAAQGLSHALARRLDTLFFVLVKHYAPDSYRASREGHTFDLVQMRKGKPSWTPLTAQQVLTMTGWLPEGVDV